MPWSISWSRRCPGFHLHPVQLSPKYPGITVQGLSLKAPQMLAVIASLYGFVANLLPDPGLCVGPTGLKCRRLLNEPPGWEGGELAQRATRIGEFVAVETDGHGSYIPVISCSKRIWRHWETYGPDRWLFLVESMGWLATWENFKR